MEILGITIFAVGLGALVAAVDNSRRRSKLRAEIRAVTQPVPLPTPGPAPEPTPGPGPGPAPTPGPGPDDDEGEEFYELESDWKDECWWGMTTPADAYMDLPDAYVTYWRAEWAGEEPLRVWVDPPDLASVESTAVWEGDEIVVESVIRPKRRGWGTLLATEGQPGVEATKGEVPWRAQCIKIEVV